VVVVEGGDNLLRKRLSANDLGKTGSHQAGVHVPKGLLSYFPHLDALQYNPSTWLRISDHSENEYSWRFIYYNNAVTSNGTRNEFRLTHTRAFLLEHGAVEGDELELQRTGERAYVTRIVRARSTDGVLVLSRNGSWRSVRLRDR